MNREIKFRIYDTHFEEMCDVSSIFFPFKTKNGKPIVEGHGVSGTPYRDIELSDLNPLLQYTGLKEVYDQDIIEIWCDTDPVGFKMIGLVFWSQENLAWMVKCFHPSGREVIEYLMELAGEPEYIKVIGNIYANPERLKQ